MSAVVLKMANSDLDNSQYLNSYSLLCLVGCKGKVCGFENLLAANIFRRVTSL